MTGNRVNMDPLHNRVNALTFVECLLMSFYNFSIYYNVQLELSSTVKLLLIETRVKYGLMHNRAKV